MKGKQICSVLAVSDWAKVRSLKFFNDNEYVSKKLCRRRESISSWKCCQIVPCSIFMSSANMPRLVMNYSCQKSLQRSRWYTYGVGGDIILNKNDDDNASEDKIMVVHKFITLRNERGRWIDIDDFWEFAKKCWNRRGTIFYCFLSHS